MDRNGAINVKTTLADGRVEQTIDGLTKRVIDVAAQQQDVAVRAALIQLGWTPPDESEELRRDAERYRWLRDSDDEYGPGAFQTVRGNPVEWLEGDLLDAAIDSARGVER